MARGFGTRLLVVDTFSRASAAETAAQIRNALVQGDRNAAAQSLLQLVNSLRASDVLAVAALTADEPKPFEDGWSWAVARVLEQATSARGIPTPLWASDTVRDPTARWSPRRRSVYIESGELVSA